MDKIDFTENPTTTIPIQKVGAEGFIIFVSDSNATYVLMKQVDLPMQASNGEILISGEKFKWVRLSNFFDTSDPTTRILYDTHKQAIKALQDKGDFFQIATITEFLQKASKRGWN